MKLKCIDIEEEKGFFKKKVVKVEGLTLNKIYEGNPISDAHGDYTYTDFYFLVYNDDNEWAWYDLERFEPAK